MTLVGVWIMVKKKALVTLHELHLSNKLHHQG